LNEQAKRIEDVYRNSNCDHGKIKTCASVTIISSYSFEARELIFAMKIHLINVGKLIGQILNFCLGAEIIELKCKQILGLCDLDWNVLIFMVLLIMVSTNMTLALLS